VCLHRDHLLTRLGAGFREEFPTAQNHQTGRGVAGSGQNPGLKRLFDGQFQTSVDGAAAASVAHQQRGRANAGQLADPAGAGRGQGWGRHGPEQSVIAQGAGRAAAGAGSPPSTRRSTSAGRSVEPGGISLRRQHPLQISRGAPQLGMVAVAGGPLRFHRNPNLWPSASTPIRAR
jgi:hypothetical protein